MTTGTVKWFSLDKGFGFILPSDGTKDIFVHHSNIDSDDSRKNLYEGDSVEFDVRPGLKGSEAFDVRVTANV